MPDGTEAEARAILQDAPDEWGDNSFWDLLHERHRKLLVKRIATALRVRSAERDEARRQYENSQRTVAEVTKAFEDEEALTTDLRAQLEYEVGQRDRLAERIKALSSALSQTAADCDDCRGRGWTFISPVDHKKVDCRKCANMRAALQAGARGDKQ